MQATKGGKTSLNKKYVMLKRGGGLRDRSEKILLALKAKVLLSGTPGKGGQQEQKGTSLGHRLA